jgi:uncharacterized protein YraI
MRTVSIVLAMLLVASFFPGRTALAWNTASVTCSSDDAKNAPSITATTLATYYSGQTVTVTGERSADGIWARVALPDGRLAWMKVVCVGGTPTTPTQPTVSGRNILVVTGALNVRTGPGWWYAQLFTLNRGTVLPLGSYRNADATWVQVVLPQGQVGWVNPNYIIAGVSIWSLPVYGQTPPPPPAASATVLVALNAYSGPGWWYGALGTFYPGNTLTLGTYRTADSQWVQVLLPSGMTGWVYTGYVSLSISIWTLPVYGTTPNPPPPPAQRTHVVQYGENLFRIGLRYGINWLQIAAANGIGYPYNIYAGQVLIIP